jgi:hydrogenase maturation protease
MLLVVGMGSPHGDDQVGWRLIQELEGLDPKRIRAELVSTPMDLVGVLEGVTTLIVVDACDAGLTPGHVLVRDWPFVSEPAGRASSHGLGIDAALRLAEQLGRLPGRVILFGVQAGPTRPGDPVSSEIEQAWPGIVSQLRCLIREPCAKS